jgi:hypothetical protein
MTRIRFDAAAPAVLKIDDKTSIKAGRAADVPDDIAQMLVEADWVDVTVLAPGDDPLAKLNLDQLREHAVKVGVDAETLAALEKPGTTKAAVRAAIDAAEEAADQADKANQAAAVGDATPSEQESEAS